MRTFLFCNPSPFSLSPAFCSCPAPGWHANSMGHSTACRPAEVTIDMMQQRQAVDALMAQGAAWFLPDSIVIHVGAEAILSMRIFLIFLARFAASAHVHMFWKRASLPGWQEHRQTCINLKPPFHPTLGGSVWLQVQRYAKVTSQVISMFKFFIGFLPNFPSVDLAPHPNRYTALGWGGAGGEIVTWDSKFTLNPNLSNERSGLKGSRNLHSNR